MFRCEDVDHVGQQERVVTRGELVPQQIPLVEPDAAGGTLRGEVLPGHGDHVRELEQPALDGRVAVEDANQERAGSPAQVKQPTVSAELVAVGQRDRGVCGGRLDPGGEDPLGLGVQAGDEAAALARPDGPGELDPGPVAHIQVTQERPQVAAAPPAQERIGHRAVPVQGPVSL